MTEVDRVLRAFVRNPRALAKRLKQLDFERSLIEYTRIAWRQLEPGQPFRCGWAHEAIAEHLEAVTSGQIRNLLINVPPGFTKSTFMDVMWPTWEWGPRSRPDIRYITWSYADHITKRNNETARRLIRSPLYQRLWGDRFKLLEDQDEKKFFRNTAAGFKMASTIRGVGMGERADRLLLDDPNSVEGIESEADTIYTASWFGGTMTSRVRNANKHAETVDGIIVQPSSTVVIMQRVGRKDISGVILDNGLDFEHLLIEMEYEGADHPARRTSGWRPSSIGYRDPRGVWMAVIDGWRELQERETARPQASFRQFDADQVDANVAWNSFVDLWVAIARDQASLADSVRYSRATVEEQKQRLRLKRGSNAVASQFRQWPHEGTGTLFKKEWFSYVDARDLPTGAKDDVRGWDLAASDSPMSDATATVKLRMGVDGKIYVLHADQVRRTPGGVDDFIKETVERDGHDAIQSFPQDPGSAGKHLMSYFARSLLQGARFRSSPERGNKVKRAEPISSQAEHKNVVIVRGGWNDELLDHLEEFPHGQHDDLLDALTRAYDALLNASDTTEAVGGKLFTANPYD